ncbi:MAG: DUF167 domain-containing protein [Chitinispirillales bacterium]|jgi:uncharacterized protein YggU (UPF0235/DUF167 family)|nr:DUF167 domain-containing protein [Chitinispirillales bacterium]
MASAALEVRLKPRAIRCLVKVCGSFSLEISVTSPPVDNKANEQLIGLLADALGVSRGMISIIKGKHNRNKVVRVDGVTYGSGVGDCGGENEEWATAALSHLSFIIFYFRKCPAKPINVPKTAAIVKITGTAFLSCAETKTTTGKANATEIKPPCNHQTI